MWSGKSQKYLQTFSFAMMIGATIAALVTSLPSFSEVAALWVASFACLVTLWIWWIANAFQEELLDPPDAAVGGNAVSGKLPGDLSGYQS